MDPPLHKPQIPSVSTHFLPLHWPLWLYYVAFIFASTFVFPASGAYFYVREGTEKCFRETVPEKVPVTVTYHNPDNPGVMCVIVYRDSQNRQVFQKEVPHSDPKGKVAYLTTAAGEHRVCIVCASSKWFSTTLLKWSISIEFGDSDLNIQDMAKKADVSNVESRIKAVVSRIDALVAENEYERTQEEAFYKTSESINSRVLWFSVTQILLLCLTTLFSIFHLTRFFHSQKLI